MRVTKKEFEEAAFKRTCLKCGRVFINARDTKMHMTKAHVLSKNSHYLIFKEDESEGPPVKFEENKEGRILAPAQGGVQ
jgi:uncharacterized C2H2 Zn-finger protein